MSLKRQAQGLGRMRIRPAPTILPSLLRRRLAGGGRGAAAVAVRDPAIQVQRLDDGGELGDVGVAELGQLAGADGAAVGVLDVVDGFAEATVGSTVARVHGAFFVDGEFDVLVRLGQDFLRVLEPGRHAVFGGFVGQLLDVGDGV